jgi:small subunit ribosomal protein S18
MKDDNAGRDRESQGEARPAQGAPRDRDFGREGREGREGRGDWREGGREGRGEGGREGARRRGRFRGRGRRKVCRFCADKTLRIDYKWYDLLEDFVSERGRIVPSRTTGTCARHQRRLKSAIKQARNVALLPYARA